MKIAKNICLWVVFGFFAITAIGSVPSFASVTALALAILIIPISKWQDFVSKYINKKIKVIAAVILAVVTVIAFPKSDSPADISLYFP